MGCGGSNLAYESNTLQQDYKSSELKTSQQSPATNTNKDVSNHEVSKLTVSPEKINIGWRKQDMMPILQGQGPWWEKAEQLQSKTLPAVKPHLKRRGWKTIRLFVSSTFKDMHDEREHLVKRVFPELRIWCEERKLRLVECDLRWGVPKDADTRDILLACLSEIDRCYEENEFPYFMNMLSERYGWVPTDEEVPDDIKHRYKWIPGMSVTTMEVYTGSYWINNPNALYCLRNSNFLTNVDQDMRSVYVDGSTESLNSLEVLKGKLREKFGQQVFDYACHWEEKNPNGKRLQLKGLESFGNRVMEHFKKAIDRQYPNTEIGASFSGFEIQKMEHEDFMTQRSQILLGRDEILHDIQKYIKDDLSTPTPLVLVGHPGAGKSAIVAYMARETTANITCTTFFHFVGATPGSTDLFVLLSRLWQELLPREDKVPTDFTELKSSMDVILEKASVIANDNQKARVVIFIDALNQMDDEGDTHALTWLSKELPKNVRIIVSTLEGTCLDSLRDVKTMKLKEINVEPLNKETSKMIVTQLLKEYSKILDEHQLDILVSKEDAGRPLFLTVASEELRVFGDFRQLNKKINNLDGDLTGLLKQVLQRLVEENGKELVTATLCLIETSRSGLFETELLELLAIQPSLPSSGHDSSSVPIGDDKLPMVHWAKIYVGLRQFLRPAGSSGQGRLDFYHRTISKAVRHLFLQEDSSKMWWHNRVAEYFEKCKDKERKAEELPYHLEKLGDKEKLKECLLQKEMFDILYKEETKQQLMSFWRFIGGYDIASREYDQAFKKYIEQNNLKDLEKRLPIAIKLAWFCIDIGEYKYVEEILQNILEEAESEGGKDSELLCEVLYAMVTAFYQQALRVVYSTNQVYKHCSKMGSLLAPRCVKLHKKYFAKNDVYLGEVLTKCGYFQGEYLTEAQNIFEKQDYKKGLAEVYYMLGEKSQYKAIGIPVAMFQKSLDLCKSQYGYFHLKTARCFQLYGQVYWNQWVSVGKTAGWMENCLEKYQNEVKILETVQGPLHPNTVRSREDVIIILQTLGRHGEADQLLKQQPIDKDT